MDFSEHKALFLVLCRYNGKNPSNSPVNPNKRRKRPNTGQKYLRFLHGGRATSPPSGHTRIPVQDRLHHQTTSDSDPTLGKRKTGTPIIFAGSRGGCPDLYDL
ncbi:MAG: hypothetical protein ABW185_01695 [Sedimenticola sp.]